MGAFHPPGRVLPWTLAAGSVLVHQLLHLWRNLDTNGPTDRPADVFPSLGAANWLTLIRASLLALLAGFLFLPAPVFRSGWEPGLLYLSAFVMDALDGFAARLTERSSRLGRILDMHWDAFGMLAAAALLVKYGRTPFIFILVGTARYIFVAAVNFREKRGPAVYPLRHDPIRRVLAGVLMGFMSAALLPVLPSSVTRSVSVIVMIPFLFVFGRDFLRVSRGPAS